MLLGSADLQAWPWGKTTLVTINHETFTTEDFRHWWKHWKEKETPFPDSLEPFIEWHLGTGHAEGHVSTRRRRFAVDCDDHGVADCLVGCGWHD